MRSYNEVNWGTSLEPAHIYQIRVVVLGMSAIVMSLLKAWAVAIAVGAIYYTVRILLGYDSIRDFY